MTKFLFKRLLMSFYCTSKLFVNRKMEDRIIPATVLTFSFPFLFIVSGIYFLLFLSLIMNNTKSPAVLAIGVCIFITPFYYFARKIAKNGIFKWKIEQEYKTLKQNERINKIVLAFVFFWGCFIIMFWFANIAVSSHQ